LSFFNELDSHKTVTNLLAIRKSVGFLGIVFFLHQKFFWGWFITELYSELKFVHVKRSFWEIVVWVSFCWFDDHRVFSWFQEFKNIADQLCDYATLKLGSSLSFRPCVDRKCRELVLFTLHETLICSSFKVWDHVVCFSSKSLCRFFWDHWVQLSEVFD
jgi:hypothetical protein